MGPNAYAGDPRLGTGFFLTADHCGILRNTADQPRKTEGDQRPEIRGQRSEVGDRRLEDGPTEIFDLC